MSLLALTALALILRLVRLDAQSLWVDEAFSIKYAALWKPLTIEGLLDNLHGPLHALLLHGWVRLFGAGEWALRAPHALIGAMTVPLLYWALRPSVSHRVSLLSCALLAISPFHLWYSQEVRNYVLAMFFVVLSTGLFQRLWLRSGFSRAGLYGLACAGALWSNLACAFALVAHGAGRLFARSGPGWRRLFVAWAIALVCLSPWLERFWRHRVEPSGALSIRSVAAEERLRGETTSPLLGIPYAYFVFSLGYSFGPSLDELRADPMELPSVLELALIAAAGVAFAVAACFGACRLWSLPSGRLWVVLAIAPVLLTFGVSTRNLKVFNPRYACAALPAYLVVVAHGLSGLRVGGPGRAGAGRRALQTLVAAGVLAPTGLSLAQYETSPRYWKEDARALSAHLQSHVGPNDLIFFVGTDEPLQQYYWRGIREGAGGVRKADHGDWWDRPIEERFERFSELAGRAEVVYVAFLREEFVDPDDRWRAWLRENRPPREVVPFTGCEIWVLDGGASGAARPEGGVR